jgi:hypothetical protein
LQKVTPKFEFHKNSSGLKTFVGRPRSNPLRRGSRHQTKENYTEEPMPNYKFKVHDGGTGSETLGAAVLGDDDEALAFANRVIRELIHHDARLYTKSWTMEVTAGKRGVASAPFMSEATEDGADAFKSRF